MMAGMRHAIAALRVIGDSAVKRPRVEAGLGMGRGVREATCPAPARYAIGVSSSGESRSPANRIPRSDRGIPGDCDSDSSLTHPAR